MLIIVILASALSLAVYLNALKTVTERQARCNPVDLTDGAKESPIVFANKAQGVVSLEILPPEEESPEK